MRLPLRRVKVLQLSNQDKNQGVHIMAWQPKALQHLKPIIFMSLFGPFFYCFCWVALIITSVRQ